MSAIFECRGLSKQFGHIVALDNISFELQPGRIVGLLGPNGSGKTTLIKLANGLLTPNYGEIFIGGKPVGTETKSLVSYLPDKSYFEDSMKVIDCVNLFTDFYQDFQKDKAMSLLSFMSIDTSLRFRSLSKGTKEKVQLILVLSRNALIYLLDEPIGGVDPAARDQILDTIITNYNVNGTVLISTHLIQDIERVLDDVIFLMNGRIERVGSVDGIREAYGKSIDEVFREVFRW